MYVQSFELGSVLGAPIFNEKKNLTFSPLKAVLIESNLSFLRTKNTLTL